MAKGGKGAKGSSKDERRAKKASANRVREHRRESRRALDRSELAQFAVLLKGNNLLLREVERDGNCFFRSLADQILGSLCSPSRGPTSQISIFVIYKP